MNVVQRRPVVSIRTHRTLDSTEENLSSAGAFFGVPTVRSAAVKAPKLIDQMFDVCRLNDSMVVIWAIRTRRRFGSRALLTPRARRRQSCQYVAGCDQCNDGVHNKPPKREIADVQSWDGAEVNATDTRASCAIPIIPRVAFD